jgi:hypothetical protein
LGLLCLAFSLCALPALGQRIVVLDEEEEASATGGSTGGISAGDVPTAKPEWDAEGTIPDDSEPSCSSTSNDMVSLGGEVVVPAGMVVRGDAVCILGSVRVDGTVRGDAVSIGGNIHVGPSGVIRGEAVSIGGRIHEAAGAQIGERVQINVLSRVGSGPGAFLRSGWVGFFAHLLFVGLIGWVLLKLGTRRWVAMIATLKTRTGGALLAGIGAGIVYWILVVPLVLTGAVLLAVTVLGIPLIPVLLLALILLPIPGYAVTGALLGSAVRGTGDPADRNASHRWVGGAYLLGHLLLSLPGLLAVLLQVMVGAWAGIPGVLFFIAWGIVTVAVAFGWGAILLSRFGKRFPGEVVGPVQQPLQPPTPPAAVGP